MAKAVFTAKVFSSYDDLPEERYHFPRTYLGAAREAVGDWIVYYEPRRVSTDLSSSGGRQSYFATARVKSVRPDPNQPNHYYAFVSDYLEFDRPVPFREGDFYYERGLRKPDGSTNKGSFGRSVRLLMEDEFALIVAAGFQTGIEAGIRIREGVLPSPDQWRVTDRRRIVERLSTRPFRDRVFTTGVKKAYDDTCAISGLKIVNGGGRAEAQAAHIRPVAANGPDSPRNGVALSSTFHWMFDRGLLSIADDYSLLLKRDALPENVLALVNPDRRLRLPEQRNYQPHPRFLKYHRNHVFKG